MELRSLARVIYVLDYQAVNGENEGADSRGGECGVAIMEILRIGDDLSVVLLKISNAKRLLRQLKMDKCPPRPLDRDA